MGLVRGAAPSRPILEEVQVPPADFGSNRTSQISSITKSPRVARHYRAQHLYRSIYL